METPIWNRYDYTYIYIYSGMASSYNKPFCCVAKNELWCPHILSSRSWGWIFVVSVQELASFSNRQALEISSSLALTRHSKVDVWRQIWLVVSNPLKNISQIIRLDHYPNYWGKSKMFHNVPNHQPEIHSATVTELLPPAPGAGMSQVLIHQPSQLRPRETTLVTLQGRLRRTHAIPTAVVR